LENKYGEDLVSNRFPNEESIEGHEEFNKYRVLTGHLKMSFDLYNYITWPFVHLTIFRDPVDRMLSHYYHLRSQNEAILHDVAISNTIEQVVEGNLFIAENNRLGVNNTMCKYLSDIPESKNPHITDIFDSAKYNLENRITMFGFTDRYYEFVAIAARRFQWSGPIEVIKEAHGTTRPPLLDIPKSTIYVIEDHNYYDIKLYRYAQQIYEERRMEWLR
jgi:hypothetical protein